MVANVDYIDPNHNMVDVVPIINSDLIHAQVKPSRRRIRTSVKDVDNRKESREMINGDAQDKISIFFSPPRDGNDLREPVEEEYGIVDINDEPLPSQMEGLSIFRSHLDSPPAAISPTIPDSFWTPNKSSLLSLKRANPIYDSDSDDFDEAEQYREKKRIRSPLR